MTEKILCVDDELAILAGFQRQFRNQFSIVSAVNGQQALDTFAERGPFAVVMSDYNMPGMNGLHFLRRVREQSPDTVRIILTGKADAEAGLAAVNEGILFRFLTKPCSPDLLAATFRAALAQYRLIVSDRTCTERIVEASTGLLADIQKYMQPEVIARVSRVETLVRELLSLLQIAEPSRFELAAKLSHLGCIGVPASVVTTILTAGEGSEDEKLAFQKHAKIGSQILRNTPGLDSVATMIERQFDIKPDFISDQPLKEINPVIMGSQLLRLANTLDSHLLAGKTYSDAINRMSFGDQKNDPVLIEALKTATKREATIQRRTIFLNSMRTGMLAQDDFLTHSGLLIVAKGATISNKTLLELQHNFETGNIDLAASFR
ncbi:MAG: response regulator [Acidobacteriaceae bacterium]|nr:response regulator [Acidobacteriaceae bacterium]